MHWMLALNVRNPEWLTIHLPGCSYPISARRQINAPEWHTLTWCRSFCCCSSCMNERVLRTHERCSEKKKHNSPQRDFSFWFPSRDSEAGIRLLTLVWILRPALIIAQTQAGGKEAQRRDSLPRQACQPLSPGFWMLIIKKNRTPENFIVGPLCLLEKTTAQLKIALEPWTPLKCLCTRSGR